MIEKSFLVAGITVRPDGSQDNLISIKGIEIGYTGWETAADTHIKSEELVDRLRDNEEIAYGPDEDFDEDILIYTLQQLKVAQLQKMLSFNKLPTKGKKNGLVERLRRQFTGQGPKRDSITVQIGNPGVIFEV